MGSLGRFGGVSVRGRTGIRSGRGYLDSSPEVAEDARRDSKGTVGLRLTPTKVVAKQKMNQNKPDHIIDQVIDELEGDGPYASPELAREMRIANER